MYGHVETGTDRLQVVEQGVKQLQLVVIPADVAEQEVGQLLLDGRLKGWCRGLGGGGLRGGWTGYHGHLAPGPVPPAITEA